jgi:hypothetical protein
VFQKLNNNNNNNNNINSSRRNHLLLRKNICFYKKANTVFITRSCVDKNCLVMLMLFSFLIYARCLTERIQLMQFLLFSSFFFLPWTLLVFEVPLGTSESFLCFTLVCPSQTVPPPGVPLQQIQLVVILMSSEGKLSHLVRRDITYF